MITFRKTAMPLGATLLERMSDFLVWYAKDKKLVKYRKLFEVKEVGNGTMYTWLELEDGTRRPMTQEERKSPKNYPKGARAFRLDKLSSAGYTQTCMYDFEFEGKTYRCGKTSWKTTREGMNSLIKAGRVMAPAENPCYVLFHEDYPVQPLNNIWDDTGGATDMRYVVQTSEKVISRCILMTSDPGDLILDITCGSGTTAYSAEKWGRRWITCDTSRVAITIARQRLLTATFDSYKLADPQKGISSGFVYKSVPHVTLKSIANNEPPSREILYDQPEIDSGKIRISGPFNIEALPVPVVFSPDEAAKFSPYEAARHDSWREQLLSTGIVTAGGTRIRFSRVDPLKGTRWLDAEAWTDEEPQRRAVVCFADSNTLMDTKRVGLALDELEKQRPTPSMMIFAAFQFDPESQYKISATNWPGVTLFMVKMNDDLNTSDLKRNVRTDQSFWLVGQPDAELVRDKDGKYRVRVLGFDYISVKDMKLESGGSDRIAMWMIDPDYNSMEFTPSQIFFPLEGKSGGWNKLAGTLRAEVDQEKIAQYSGTESLPFTVKEGQKVAVKIIDDRGIESMRLLEVKGGRP